MTHNLLLGRRSFHWKSLAFAVVVTLAPGCSSKHLTPEQKLQADLAEYKQEIRKIIPDSARAAQLEAITDEFQQLAQQGITRIKTYREKIAALNTKYDATREEYETLFDKQDAARETFQRQAEALRGRMVVFTTDAEWEALKKARLRTLEADLNDLLS